jgi:hypothetical protein
VRAKRAHLLPQWFAVEEATLATAARARSRPDKVLMQHQATGITATEIPASTRRVYAATYGAPSTDWPGGQS